MPLLTAAGGAPRCRSTVLPVHLPGRNADPRPQDGQAPVSCVKRQMQASAGSSSSRNRRIWRQHALLEKSGDINIWVDFVAIKSVPPVTLIGILPKQNVAWEPDARTHKWHVHIEIEGRAATANAPPSNPHPFAPYTVGSCRPPC